MFDSIISFGKNLKKLNFFVLRMNVIVFILQLIILIIKILFNRFNARGFVICRLALNLNSEIFVINIILI